MLDVNDIVDCIGFGVGRVIEKTDSEMYEGNLFPGNVIVRFSNSSCLFWQPFEKYPVKKIGKVKQLKNVG